MSCLSILLCSDAGPMTKALRADWPRRWCQRLHPAASAPWPRLHGRRRTSAASSPAQGHRQKNEFSLELTGTFALIQTSTLESPVLTCWLQSPAIDGIFTVEQIHQYILWVKEDDSQLRTVSESFCKDPPPTKYWFFSWRIMSSSCGFLRWFSTLELQSWYNAERLGSRAAERQARGRFNIYRRLFAHERIKFSLHGPRACQHGSVNEPVSALLSVLTARLTCSFLLLTPSGPSRLTACLTKSVRPQLSIRKPRSCRNFASAEAASSFLEAQKQSSVLKGNV